MKSPANRGATADKRRPPPGKRFVKGDPRINRQGPPRMPPHLREVLGEVAPEYVPRLLEALTALVERGGKDASVRGVIGQQLLESFIGKPGPDGWLERLRKAGVVPDAPKADAPSTTDLAAEIRKARERAGELEAQLQQLGDAAAPALLKAHSDAVDLVRRLCATQAEYHPGGEAQGDFTVEVVHREAPPAEGVPDLVADRLADEAPAPEAEDVQTFAPAGTGNALVDGVPE